MINPWFKRISIKSWCFIVISLWLIAEIFFLPVRERHWERKLNREIEDAIATGPQKIPLKNLVDFEWDEVCYAAAPEFYYSDQPNYTLFALTGKAYDGYVPNWTCDSENFNDLVFLKDKEVVMPIRITNCSLYPSHQGNKSECFGPHAFLSINDPDHEKYPSDVGTVLVSE